MVPRVAMIGPVKAFAHQFRHQAAVIDMGMGQQHRVDVGGAKWKRAVVQRLQRLRPLEQAAVDQQAAGRGLEQIAGAGHGAGGAAESDAYAHDDDSGIVPRRFRCAGPRPTRRRARSHWSDAARCRSNGWSECRRAQTRAPSRRKQRMGDDRVDRCRRPRPPAPCAQAISVPPDETMSSTSSTGRPGDQRGIGEDDRRPTDRRAASSARPRSAARAGRRGRSTQGCDSASGPTTTVRGSSAPARSAVGDRRHGGEIVGLDAGEHVADCRRCGADAHRR